MSEIGSDRLERILDAARRILGETGVEGLTMRGLAKESCVSPVTLYNRFGNKDNIIALVVVDNFERKVDAPRGAKVENISPLDALIQLLRLEQDQTLAGQAFSKALVSMYFKHDNDRELPNMLYSMLCDRIQPLLDEMQRKKLLHQWADTELLSAEIADRILSAGMKWSRKEFSDKMLLDHILFSTLSCLVGFSAGSQLKQIGPLLKKITVLIK